MRRKELTMKNMTKAIIANYTISTATTAAVYAVRPNASSCLLTFDSPNKETAREARKDIAILTATTAVNIGLNLLSNKMITGHYIRIWK